ncbi:hypothetical protein PILCRDRAFT_682435 [Piloderma croceum F 1598]|uniref:Uncharacterized protein n=1 Tax=Piloderma croceum (strain F 1598) TaxID=765440 RepID=A0A0C3F5D7_PILCF|nr:hypothetical protein PILCRDRAFT_682435 [Piloderma croceum F 1598]
MSLISSYSINFIMRSKHEETHRHFLHGVTIANSSSFSLLTARSLSMLRLTVKARSYAITQNKIRSQSRE